MLRKSYIDLNSFLFTLLFPLSAVKYFEVSIWQENIRFGITASTSFGHFSIVVSCCLSPYLHLLNFNVNKFHFSGLSLFSAFTFLICFFFSFQMSISSSTHYSLPVYEICSSCPNKYIIKS